MNIAKPLPDEYATRYHAWKSGKFQEKKDLFDRLSGGQSPHAMIISCCDSRVLLSSIFGAEPGEFFIHRNIANLVPPYRAEGSGDGTSAAIEYGVTALKVPHLIVVGHSACGGVAGCHAKCSGQAPELDDPSSFVGRWIEPLRPAYERTKDREGDVLRAMELAGVQVSLENLAKYPFVRDAVEAGTLSLHGLWTDIGSGDLLQFDAAADEFRRV